MSYTKGQLVRACLNCIEEGEEVPDYVAEELLTNHKPDSSFPTGKIYTIHDGTYNFLTKNTIKVSFNKTVSKLFQ